MEHSSPQCGTARERIFQDCQGTDPNIQAADNDPNRLLRIMVSILMQGLLSRIYRSLGGGGGSAMELTKQAVKELICAGCQ
jgi:hypothetical protein